MQHLSRRSLLLGLAATGLAACESRQSAALRNLGDEKAALLEYQRSGQYMRDIAAMAGTAQAYVAAHPLNIPKPALVLDIDETSLSNWKAMKIDDFGYIPNGPCDLERGPCGYAAWEASGQADVIAPVLELHRAARARGIDVFFITGRREAKRAAVEGNLRDVGYEGFMSVAMQPNDLHVRSAADFKAPERAKIAAAGYTIIANVGDQPSDLAGGTAERTFLIPNPYYRIP
jgi:predicted secreted acid phosphatase